VLLVESLSSPQREVLLSMNQWVIFFNVSPKRIRVSLLNTLFARQNWYRNHCKRLWSENKLAVAELLHIAFARYFFANEYLASSEMAIENVLISDSRDVIFQRNPFDLIPGGLVTGLEDGRIIEEDYNRNWIRELYGEIELGRLGSNRIICSGVTLGPRTLMTEYLTTICDEIENQLKTCMLNKIFDQGVHNYIIRKGRLPGITLAQNGDRTIATLGISDMTNFKISESHGLLNLSGEKIAIVHQYDRKPDVSAIFRRQYTIS
jgi:hypothetical protein